MKHRLKPVDMEIISKVTTFMKNGEKKTNFEYDKESIYRS